MAEPRKYSWKNREEDLRAVKRYHTIKTMFYRTDLLLHSQRVPEIVRALLPEACAVYPDINSKLALAISKYHDDPEMVTGDVPLQMKLLMDDGALLKLKQGDLAAAEHLVKWYRNPLIGEFRYKDLLLQSIFKNSREAQLHSFADKLEGFSEAVHEVLAGNMAFLEALINYVSKTFGLSAEKFPLLADLFTKGSSFDFPVVELKPYFDYGRRGPFLHTQETLELNSGIPFYELWKKVTLSLPGGVERLTTQVEFYPPPEPRLTVVPSIGEEKRGSETRALVR